MGAPVLELQSSPWDDDSLRQAAMIRQGVFCLPPVASDKAGWLTVVC